MNHRVGLNTKYIVDGPLFVATAATMFLAFALTWFSWGARDEIDAAVFKAAETQNVLTAIVANLTRDVDILMDDITGLERRRAALQKRRDEAALHSGEADLAQLNVLKEHTSGDLKKLRDFIDAMKKELMEFIASKK